MKPHIRLARVDGCQLHGLWVCYKPQPGMRSAPDLNSRSFMGVGLSPQEAYTEWQRAHT